MKDRYKKKFISKQSFFSARGMTKIFMFLCIVGFAMPFLTVSCGSETFVTLTGFDVMLGKQVFVLDRLRPTPTNPLIMLAFVACIATLIAAFLPKYPISRPVWGLSSIGGLLIIGYYIMTSGNQIAKEAQNLVNYEVPSNITTMPGSGAILCAMCFIAAFIMLIRKLFFEEADLLVLTPDEREVYEAIKAEEEAEQPERDRLRQELDEKLKPILDKEEEAKAEATAVAPVGARPGEPADEAETPEAAPVGDAALGVPLEQNEAIADAVGADKLAARTSEESPGVEDDDNRPAAEETINPESVEEAVADAPQEEIKKETKPIKKTATKKKAVTKKKGEE